MSSEIREIGRGFDSSTDDDSTTGEGYIATDDPRSIQNALDPLVIDNTAANTIPRVRRFRWRNFLSTPSVLIFLATRIQQFDILPLLSNSQKCREYTYRVIMMELLLSFLFLSWDVLHDRLSFGGPLQYRSAHTFVIVFVGYATFTMLAVSWYLNMHED